MMARLAGLLRRLSDWLDPPEGERRLLWGSLGGDLPDDPSAQSLLVEMPVYDTPTDPAWDDDGWGTYL